MHRTRQPLCTWLWAAYLMVTDKRGISAVQLQKQLGIGRYETAFNMLHKLRAAMVNPDREPLRGRVEVDETYIGGPVPGKRGRGTGKALVIGAVELRGGKPTRIRLKKIGSVGSDTVIGFVTASVERGSEELTERLAIAARAGSKILWARSSRAHSLVVSNADQINPITQHFGQFHQAS